MKTITITRKLVEKVRNSQTHIIKQMLLAEINPSSVKFLEYEIAARTAGAQCDCDVCYRNDGFVIIEEN